MKWLNSCKGKVGEDKAVKYLQKKGYKILARNYKTKYAEIDIIAIKKDILTFVEVKSRTTTDYGRGCEAVNYRKMKKIRANAVIYSSSCKIPFEGITFDIIEVDLTTGKINHIVSAF